MQFTAVVVTWNSGHDVERLIGSVDRFLSDDCRLLFVDNASSDDTVQKIRAASPVSRVLELHRNLGFAAANNIGVRAADTDVVVLLNPDTVMVDDTLAALAEAALGERAFLAPRLLNEDGSVQVSAWAPLASWESALISIWPGTLLPRRLRARCEPWRFAESLPAGWISGACLAAGRDLLLEFGPFDERFVLYGEDGDLCVRGWLAGVPSISAADIARVIHLGGRSASQAFSDSGTRRKILARWWIVEHRIGRIRGLVDLAMQFVQHLSRWLGKRAMGRNAAFESTWLRAALAAARQGRPKLPSDLPGTADAGMPHNPAPTGP
jgi:N-acetylglucosaminyl-diphospho-decaprenol L-rhamnosyltransferase